MIFNRYKITLPFGTASTGTTSLDITGNTQPSKYITIPLKMEFTPVDYGEDVERIVNNEIIKSVGTPFDGEQIKYKSITTQGYTINFKFFDENSNTFINDYSAAGFVIPNDFRKNGFKRSYFRLYFYDANEPQKRNLLFFEELDVNETTQPTLRLNKIYWFRNDEIFNTTLQNRDVYVIARFFNAKTGKIHDFINTPPSVTTPLNITQFSMNPDWWTSPVRIGNPRVNNGEYRFGPLSGFGSNTSTTMTFTEQIIV